MSTVFAPTTPSQSTRTAQPTAKYETVADLIRVLGKIPANRILWNPTPGTATEADLIRYVNDANKRLCRIDRRDACGENHRAIRSPIRRIAISVCG